MIKGACPICSKRFEIASLDQNPAFPFCSDRCRLIDLGRWIDERYTVPEPAARRGAEDADEASAELAE
jgi:endogenous inhibitor of DNA gyrase (YacG/DUF329 family)